jgi:hypothetical protein
VAVVTNYLGLQVLRNYFNVVAKAYTELNSEEARRACGEYVAVAHLGDALMANFFKRKGFDAVYVPETQCMTLFNPSEATLEG